MRPLAAIAIGAGLLCATLTACSGTSSSGAAAPAASVAGSSTPVAPSESSDPVTSPSSPTPASPSVAVQATGAATKTYAACSLVTSTDAQAVLGTAAGTGQEVKVGLYDSCTYAGAHFVVLVRNIDKATFDKSASLNPGGAKPIAGIGDDAYVASGALLVWQNGTEISLGVMGGSSDPLAAEKKLAAAALARL